MNKIWKFFKQNLILIVPSIFVLLLLVGFMIFGLTRPGSADVISELNIIEIQQQQQDAFFNEYEKGYYSVGSPFVVLDPYQVAPLSALMMFETSVAIQYEVVVKGKEENITQKFIKN